MLNTNARINTALKELSKAQQELGYYWYFNAGFVKMMRNKFKENMFMKDKLIEHLRKKENHYKDRAYFKNLYMYWAMYLLVFIIPNSIFEILPSTI